MKISGKPASIGAIIMLGGGLMIYWALSQWKLFGLGGAPVPTISGNSGPPTTSDSETIGGKIIHRMEK